MASARASEWRGVHSLILPDEAPKLTNIIITLIHQMEAHGSSNANLVQELKGALQLEYKLT